MEPTYPPEAYRSNIGSHSMGLLRACRHPDDTDEGMPCADELKSTTCPSVKEQASRMAKTALKIPLMVGSESIKGYEKIEVQTFERS
jgi:hypothetical protein